MQGYDETIQIFRNRSAAGGVNTRVFASDIQDDEAQLLQNMDCSTPGQRVARSGSTLTATGMTKGPVLALGTFRPDGGASVLLAITPGIDVNHRLWEWDGTGSVWTEVGTLTNWTAGDAATYSIVGCFEASITTSKFIAYLSTSQPSAGHYYYDGTTLASSGGGTSEPATLRIAHVNHNVRVFQSGSGEYRSNLKYSNTGFSTTQGQSAYPAANTIQVNAGKGQEIVRMTTFRNQLVVIFLTDSIRALNTAFGETVTSLSGGYMDPSEAWVINDIHDSIGCCGFHAVANVGEDIYFADQHGNIRSLARTGDDAGSGVKSLPVSEPIDAWIKRINPTAKGRITLAAHDRWLLVGLPIDSAVYPSHVFALDVARSSAMGRPTWDGPWISSNGAMQPYCMVQAILEGASASADQNPTLYAGSGVTAQGEVYRYFRGNDDAGSAIEYQEVTKRINFGTLELDKVFKRFSLYALGSGLATMQIEANLDAIGWEHVGYVDLSGDTPLLPQALPLSLGGSGVVEDVKSLEDLAFEIRATDISFRMTATATTPVKVLGYNVAAFVETWDREPRDA